MNDEELLKAYLSETSQEAFAELVRRHIGLVYATARRHLREAAAAEEVTQQTFCVLAKKAASIRNPRYLTPWLHRTCHQLSLVYLRTEQRRTHREQVVAMHPIDSDSDDRWAELEPWLDRALQTLSEADRTALLLRYVEARRMAEVGAALGISEAAAKMRIGRALDKLRSGFARHGLTCSAAVLALMLERHAQASAPDGLVTTVLTATRGLRPTIPTLASSAFALLRRAFLPAAGLAVVLFGVWVAAVRLGGPKTSTTLSGGSTLPGSLIAGEAQPSNAASVPVSNRIQFTVVEAETGEALSGVNLRAVEQTGSLPSLEILTDSQGRGSFPKPTQRGDFYFRVAARRDGYVSQVVSWSRSQRDDPADIPSEYVIRLKQGIRIGGLVQDPNGRPIGNVAVELYGQSYWEGAAPRERAFLEEYGRETVRTDDHGHWSFAGLPENWSRVEFTFRSSDFITSRFLTDKSDRSYIGVGRLSSAELLAGNALVTLQPGKPLVGRILDLQGQPVASAQIVQNREWDEPTLRKQSSADGAFEFRNLGEGPVNLTVQAPGFAATNLVVPIPTVSPVTIQLSPGNPLRGRVLDGSGHAIVGAQIDLNAPLGQNVPFLMNLKTDADGRFHWDQAPGPTLSVAVWKVGFLSQAVSLKTDGKENSVVLENAQDVSPVRVTGRVWDAQTGSPLDQFQIRVAANGDHRAVNKAGEHGEFSLSLVGSETSIEVRAQGYAPQSQDLPVPASAPLALEFRLTPAAGWSGLVQLPNGQPAVGAEIALITASRMPTIGARRFLWRDQANVTEADANGAFHFEPEPPEMPVGRRLVALHPDGYAEHDADTFSPGQILVLRPWGRVQGRVHGRSDYPQELKVHLLARPWTPWSPSPGDPEHFSVQPNEDGEFTIPALPPGYYSVGIIARGRGTIDKRLTVEVLPGRTSQVELFDDGMAITAQLLTPDLPPDFDFQHSTAVLERKQSRPVDLPRVRSKDYPSLAAYEAAAREQTPKLLAYWQSKDGLAAWMEQRTYALELSSDGRLTGRAIAPGEYNLRVMVRTQPPGHPGGGGMKVLESAQPIRIDPAPDGSINGHVDLGRIATKRTF